MLNQDCNADCGHTCGSHDVPESDLVADVEVEERGGKVGAAHGGQLDAAGTGGHAALRPAHEGDHGAPLDGARCKTAAGRSSSLRDDAQMSSGCAFVHEDGVPPLQLLGKAHRRQAVPGQLLQITDGTVQAVEQTRRPGSP